MNAAAVEGQQQVQDDLEFGKLFNEAEEKLTVPEKPLQDQITDDQKADDQKAQQDAADAEAARVAAEKEAQGAAGTAGTSGDDLTKDLETSEQRYKTLQGIYRHEKDEWLNEKDRLLSELEAAKTTAEPNKPDKDKEDDPTLKEILAQLDLTDEQKAQLADYDAEFDVVSKMEGLKRKTEMARLKLEFRDLMKEFRQEFATQLQPAQEFIVETKKSREEDERKEHFQIIENAHPDYSTHRDSGAIKKWIEGKPLYLQKGLSEIYAKGTAEDIVEMLSDFKRENEIPAEPNKGNAEEEAARLRAKEDKKKTLTSPVTKRGAVNASMSVATDYGDAFDEAINKIK